MSRSASDQHLQECDSNPGGGVLKILHSKTKPLTAQLQVQRVVPQAELRMIGPWCFLDHFGPLTTPAYQDFNIPPHPHIGLQTITWLYSGELMHYDSLGYQQALRPGELNLMTSGRGISHAEIAQDNPTQPLHGLQLWSALPPADELTYPRFDHYRDLPQFALGECTATLIVGDYYDRLLKQRWQSPALSFHPSLALSLTTPRTTVLSLSLNPLFEHAIYIVSGSLYLVDSELTQPITAHQLLDLGSERGHLEIELAADTRVLVLGGEPFGQHLFMRWNFVSTELARVEQAQQDWDNGHPRFGDVNTD
ncbi:MAG: pirin family protein [Pseudidiomarina maritima]|nr:pirin family protein [Pseudidiomarina maritima]